ncbi:hypothetical protein [Bacillus cereus]|uniref:Uncharacterized protein n=1 Tax=Bacillus cereus VD184 TaxID=1053242 RepID=A0A9W5R0I1_BACCE|nr:hypothetical protein [Bacillus cereus]EOQ01058.1 hypothetical protein IKC_06566 [Bacillus cereus VD184]
MDYKRDNLNRHALNALTMYEDAYEPSINLGVEDDEYMGGYALLVKHTAKQPKAFIPDPISEPWEKSRENFKGEQIKQEDFPNDFYVGSAIMGV